MRLKIRSIFSLDLFVKIDDLDFSMKPPSVHVFDVESIRLALAQIPSDQPPASTSEKFLGRDGFYPLRDVVAHLVLVAKNARGSVL